MIDRLDHRTAGRTMQGVAGAGVAVALIGTFVGWSLIGRLDAAAGDTLALTEEALVTIEETVAVVDGVVGSTVDALEAVEDALTQVVETTAAGRPVLEGVADLGLEVAPRLESTTETLRSLQDVGATIDSLLRGLDSLPVLPRYDPDTSLGEQFGRLADDIEPLAQALRQTSERIGPAVASTADLEVRLVELEEAIGHVRADLAGSQALLDEYRATARDAVELTTSTGRGLGRDVLAARLLVVVGAAVFAAAQIVPYWVGSELIARDRGEGDRPG